MYTAQIYLKAKANQTLISTNLLHNTHYGHRLIFNIRVINFQIVITKKVRIGCSSVSMKL